MTIYPASRPLSQTGNGEIAPRLESPRDPKTAVVSAVKQDCSSEAGRIACQAHAKDDQRNPHVAVGDP